MSETAVISTVRGNVGAAEPDGGPAQQGKNGTQGSVVSAPEQNPGASPASAPAPVEPDAVRDVSTLAEPAAADVGGPGPRAPATEIELKLLVDPDRLADFNDVGVIATHARSKGTRKHLKSIYYDTPRRTLRRNGLSLRVRQSGARFVQTVKLESAGDPLRRGEWEASVPSADPDVALAMPFVPEELRPEIAHDGLEAVFTADIHRHERVLDMPAGTIEIAFDHGLLKAGAWSQPVSEIELELKGGSPSTIYDLALRLSEHGPVKPSIRSKSARGHDLAADTPPTARKPGKLHLDPAVALDDAFATILRACLHHLLQSLPAAEDGRDPEGIHQLRVALRRLRTAFDLMRAAGPLSRLDTLRSEAKWLAQGLSAARDWDIFRKNTLPEIASACPSIGGFDALGDVAEQRRTDAYRKVRFVLADRRATSFILGLGAWIETRGWRGDIPPARLGQFAGPAANFARQLLSTQHAKVLKRGRHFKSLDPDQRHRLRLAVKKLRYVAEFLLPLSGPRKAAKRFADKLAEFQEELGAYNDMAVTAKLLAGLGTASLDGGHAAAAITGWQARAMIGGEPRLRQAWSDFAKTKPPWSVDAEAERAP
ncbi:CYTH and CHAD domain-containing protein [Bradyrhizobium sp.]|uniref:CYTH and CHAD domain-containing protein n=1 Tax=Bradyrhizobium sp. TaxID=376 RepID=UPI0025C0F45E|nr:CYTH and CHAD domain-containing protein [Bradyrhizobium sp.]MBV8921004.1 CHAD domain-containing protein [Bradyrhizobium sp.]